MLINIALPLEGKCLLKKGQRVDFSTPFLELNKEKEKEIFLAEKLNIPAKDIFKHLKKFVGDKVKKNELLAVKTGLFSTQKYFCQEPGIITEINHEKGTVKIKTQSEEELIINCYFQGEVKEIKKELLVLAVNKSQEYSLNKCSVNTGGKTIYLHQLSNETATELENKIVILKKINELALNKIEVLGAKGVVSPLPFVNEKSLLPFFQIKDLSTFDLIFNAQFPYCLTQTVFSKIIFYQ